MEQNTKGGGDSKEAPGEGGTDGSDNTQGSEDDEENLEAIARKQAERY